jgi:predicted alpha/beta superfamily hydrolase
MKLKLYKFITQNLLPLLFIIAFIPVYLSGQENPSDYRLKIYSEALQEERTISIHLPDNYKDSKQSIFPVLYILDAEGGNQWNRSVKTANDLFKSGIIPDMIFVGIHNTVRNRDMIPAAVAHRPGSGGSKEFLTFIGGELMQHINKSYRTNKYNILFGCSNAGIFAVYALLEEPGLFQAIIASSPMIGHCNDFMTELANRSLRNKDLKNLLLFVIYGTEDSNRVLDYVPQFYSMLKSKASNDFRSELIILKDEGHVPDSSLLDGLKFIYRNK